MRKARRDTRSTPPGRRTCRRVGSPASSAACAWAPRTRSTWSTGATSPTRRRRRRSPHRRSSGSTPTATWSDRGATTPPFPVRSTAASSITRAASGSPATPTPPFRNTRRTESCCCRSARTENSIRSTAPGGARASTRRATNSTCPPAWRSTPATATSTSRTATATAASPCSTRTASSCGQWGRQATEEETRSGAPGVFAEVVHCIAMSNAGLIYACDRQGNRVQVFQKDGTFVRNIPIPNASGKLPDKRGTAWWVAFSPDREQKLLYVMNGGTEQVHILDHASGKILSSFGRPGHQAGNFTHGHTLAVDSKGNVYVAETDWGRRVQKFKPVSSP